MNALHRSNKISRNQWKVGDFIITKKAAHFGSRDYTYSISRNGVEVADGLQYNEVDTIVSHPEGKHAVHIKNRGFVSTRMGSQTLSDPTKGTTAEKVIQKHMEILKMQHGPDVTSETL